jgi:tRNA dimethylallyltransferase
VIAAQPLWVIAGPTASGKSALALELAESLDAEIVSADSQQVYRHFDLGTAKPTPQEQRRVPHHLISVVDPDEDFSGVRYQQLADAAIADIQRRQKRVVVVGGTGLYLRILLQGVVAAPGADPALRAELTAFAEAEGAQALWEKLNAVDPQTAKLLPAADRFRIIRALEIHVRTGQPASQARAAHAFAEARHPHRLFVLEPPRPALYAAINARTRAMYDAGLVEEARSLAARGYDKSAPMRSVGYVEALAVSKGDLKLEDAIALTAQRTRNYAKRQITWFKKEKAEFLAPPYSARLISSRL